MTISRFELAFPEGHPEGRILVLGARGGDDLSPFDPSQLTVEQGHFPDHQLLAARGFDVAPVVDGQFDTAVVILPRAKSAAHARIASAVLRLRPDGRLWVDGQKTDGVDSLLKELRGLTQVEEINSKAHGKIFRVVLNDGDWVPENWAARKVEVTPGFMTGPGLFSADGIDPGSALLARHLPDKLPTRMVDLGAGWGWLAAQVLTRPGVDIIHLVEANHAAIEAARQNVTDERARFHWADACDFRLTDPVNGVVMNPPFHDGRKADPGLGASFVAAAAGLLTHAGRLWMVANRHLPYETTLREHFAQVKEIGGDNRFKIFEASDAGRRGNRKKGRT